MRIVAGIVAAFFLTAQSPPSAEQLDAKLSRFEVALTKTDHAAASAIIDELIAARTPADGQPRVDPLISSLMGRLFLNAHQEAYAVLYLAQAAPEALPEAIRAETLLAYGRALELSGQRKEAQGAYARALAASAGGRASLRARLGIARQKIVSDPSAARSELAQLSATADPADRWEAEYLSALASSLTGDRASADRFANLAWSDAGSAPPGELAPLRVSVLRAGLATVAGDHIHQRAMLAAANAGSASHGTDLGRQLPICGDDGIRPTDTVTFGAIVGPYNNHAIIPVAASRPEIVEPFYDRLAGREVIKAENPSNATGTIFTLSCVSRVNAGFVAAREPIDPMFAWIVEKGIYPAVSKAEHDTAGINRIADRIDELTKQFGPDSPLLIGPRWQMLQALEFRTASDGDVAPGRLKELRATFADGLRRAGAPPWFARLLNLRTDLDRLARSAAAGSPDLPAIEALWRNVLREIPFTSARYLLRDIQSQSDDSMNPQQASMIADLRDRAPPSLQGRDRQAFLLTMASAQKAAGLPDQARKTIASTGLASDICIRTDNPPQMLEQNFSSKDYPTELIPAELRGYTFVEFDLTPDGKPTKPRTLISLPSGLFDDAMAKGFATMRFSEPTINGKPHACRADTQAIVWRLEEENDLKPPTVLPDTTKEST